MNTLQNVVNVARSAAVLLGMPKTREEYEARVFAVTHPKAWDAGEELAHWRASMVKLVADLHRGELPGGPSVRERRGHQWYLRPSSDSVEIRFVLSGDTRPTRVRSFLRWNTPLLNRYWRTDPVGHFELWYGGGS